MCVYVCIYICVYIYLYIYIYVFFFAAVCTIAAVSTLHDYLSEMFKFALKIIRIDNLICLLKFNIRALKCDEWRPKNVSISVQLL